MSNGSFVPHVAGFVVGLLFFSLASIWVGEPVIPSVSAVKAKVEYAPPEPIPVPEGPETGEQVYARVCAACHQADGQGLPPTFPPLAESDWVNADAETPIRIVLAGLSGPITVKGTQFNQMMPSQAVLDDEQIAKALTYVRSNFGNAAGEVSAEQVAAVREKLAGRSDPWTAEELSALRGPGETAAAPGQPSTAAGEGAAPEGPAEPARVVDPAVLAAAKQSFEGICVSCHGANGDGMGPAAAALNPKPASFRDPAFWQTRDRAHLIKVITKGGPAVGKSPLMAPFGGQFSAAQIEGLADYIMSFKP
ncbi:MAG: cytochrome c [Myxococcales bacterium]|nr:cytochrome c [Myxococcales bacterium]MDD9965916.1 cytochrome c [Myxococcales bacterium]